MKRKRISKIFYIWLFTVSMSVAIIPCYVINTYGLFGEVKSVTISEDKSEQTSKIESKGIVRAQHIRGINIYNSWFEVLMIILYVSFMIYIKHLPRRETIVTLKVRLDN